MPCLSNQYWHANRDYYTKSLITSSLQSQSFYTAPEADGDLWLAEEPAQCPSSMRTPSDLHSWPGSYSLERRSRPGNPWQHRQVETCSVPVRSYRARSTWLPCLSVPCLPSAEPVRRSVPCTCCSYFSEHASPSLPKSSGRHGFEAQQRHWKLRQGVKNTRMRQSL